MREVAFEAEAEAPVEVEKCFEVVEAAAAPRVAALPFLPDPDAPVSTKIFDPPAGVPGVLKKFIMDNCFVFGGTTTVLVKGVCLGTM